MTIVTLPASVRDAELRSGSFDPNDNTIECVWTAGATVRRVSWMDGVYDEELVVSTAAVRLGRMNAGAPLLDTHRANSVAGVLGSVVPGSARIERGQGVARIRLSSAPADADTVQKIRDGIVRNVSCGYVRHQIEKIEKAGATPLWRVVDWEPYEISATPVPADPAAQFRSTSSASGYPCRFTTASAPAMAATPATIDAATARMIRREMSIALAPLYTERNSMSRNVMIRDAIVARLARAAGERAQIPDASRTWGEQSLVEIAADFIGHRGGLRNAAQVEQVMKRAFHATSDFPGIFSDALNTRLLARYQAATPTYRRFCAPYNAVDFRPVSLVRSGDFPALQRISETGEIALGTFGESKELLQVHPYGVRLNITRQMIVNDQLGAIDQMLGSYADRVMEWENGLAFEMLVSNSHAGPTLLTDATAVFAAGHNNHVTSGTAISLTSVGLGRAAMMKQTSIDGNPLNLVPVTILTGPDRLTEAEQVVASITPAAVANAQPDWIKRLAPAGDAGIAGNHWYMFADPMQAPCFVYGNLEGFEGPRLSANDPFTVQGIELKLEHDFGLAAADYRGGYHNAGAAPT